MTLTLVATAYVSSGTTPPRVQLDVTSGTGTPNPLVGSEYLTLYRNDPDGQQRQVILPLGTRLSGGVATVFDYHAPFNTVVSYVVVAGSVTADGALSAGYYDYAPSPNLLPSPLAALGRSGDPAANGWNGLARPVGDNLRFTVSGPPNTYQMVATVVPEDTTPGTYTLRTEYGAAGGTGKTYNSEIIWYDASNAQVGSTASTSGVDPTFLTLTTTRPSGADHMRIRLWMIPYTAGTYWTLTGITFNSGSSATSVPAPVFVPVTPTPTILAEANTWLIHPTNPKLSVQVAKVTALGDRVRPNKIGQFDIPGRRTPITVTDGVRRAVQSSITFRTYSDAAVSDVDDLIDDGGPVLLVTPGTAGWDAKWEWVQPLDVPYSNYVGSTQYPGREWQMPYVVIDQPSTFSSSLWTCADLAAFAGTCANAATIYDSAKDMGTDTRAA